MKVKKGDMVYIAKGKDRGRTGKIISIFPKTGNIIVEGINIKKRHVRPRRSGEKGQVVEIPGRISASNVSLLCPNCKKSARLSYQVHEHGRSRICKRCGSVV
ncbi:MAG: 50S ribosomal protein L24 [Candidatus Ryanbacteria bacterium RIFCSPHIGHO2_02_FULL_45_43]|uniref:Large ribosomal subunit protein uL24 n=1 Tax=Candidatus Ryanbacteria bacterium RIFCSPHIGHO2_01_45_13 TaxID=1802112 RepID=A0A1G2FWM1_9BACT|nr:MAG: 50S ribosomal protein L24 [Candidatus Ryanbacteria bacterium RIFCSPHIGHO2_01_FULL_44_130]OGZ42463.1 MAG: 50S ribosomal protein L24 [Candidatus Ryanbacteria bacterium RIFCSPHIGHO2_01_45_13]OGZ48480.1 MAG: 50S ribosomal protein L24 [Candidatus Ryanbacteria bacterium RIFCSPHIGHO2_02_FULL_45_43]OGZ50344.1 MAG: 50S ribosomal protein L24 [Candidatus Ryanbacteria bacterium RIFCSPHIGHO2_12_FULL_44_20]OGZ51684.1 MAG: 50S ribosomal protein L24 [Candidatus Ryanbacteria bacterium RIFCSPLOWO2_01_FUL